MKFKVHNLNIWNQNKEIYKTLFRSYDPEQKYFSTFDYDLIQHTNLDNFFFEIKNNYKIQYLQIKNLLRLFQDNLHQLHLNQLLNDTQSHTFLFTQSNKWINPLEFNKLVLQIQIKIKPGDLIDLKQNSGLGLYLIYQNHNLGNIIYIKKTLDIYGLNLPAQAWNFIAKYGWCYQDLPFQGCYLPKNAVIVDSVDSVDGKQILDNRHGFYIFIPKQNLDNPIQAKIYFINGISYEGKIIDKGPK